MAVRGQPAVRAQAITLPLFVLMNQLGMVDSLGGLWVLYTATAIPFTVFFLTGFLGSLPGALEQAAALDGASPVRTFWQIMMPLARSGIITALILNIIQHRGETMLALIFLQSGQNQTLSLALPGFLQRMRPPKYHLARLAAELLLRRLAEPEIPRHQVRLRPSIVVRESCGARKPVNQ